MPSKLENLYLDLARLQQQFPLGKMPHAVALTIARITKEIEKLEAELNRGST